MKPSCRTILSSALVILIGCAGAPGRSRKAATGPAPAAEKQPAPVHARADAFILMRCPYAAAAVRSLLALKKQLGPALDLRFHPIGLIGPDGAIDPALDEPEIRAAKAFACAEARSSADQAAAFLGCLYEGEAWQAVPIDWARCAQSAGIAPEPVKNCLDTAEGVAALAEAYGWSMEANVDASPTLIIDGRLYIGDRTEQALTAYVCYLAGRPETRPAACAGVEPPPVVSATLLYDSRCTDAERCGADGEIRLLGLMLPSLALNRVDYATDQGRLLFDRIRRADPRLGRLPLFLFDESLRQSESAMARLDQYLVPFGKGFVLAVESDWDPAAEICDNRIDDTGDGLIDCADPGCRDRRICREETRGRIELFFMSGCPFSAALLPVLDRVLGHFGRDRGQLDLALGFIGETDGDRFASLHGEEEVAEDLRMICAQELYPERYRFMEYVVCRAAAYDSSDWEPCLPKWMDKKRLERCALGDQGRTLLKESFALADRLDIEASPTLILNSRLLMDGRTGPEIVQRFCAQNLSEACGREIGPDPAPKAEPAPGSCR